MDWISRIAGVPSALRAAQAGNSRVQKARTKGIVARCQQLVAIGFVGEETGQAEEGRAGTVKKKSDRIQQDVFKTRAPALGPDMFERSNEIGGDQRPVVGQHAVKRIEADREVEIGRVEIEDMVGALCRHGIDEHGRQIAMGIEQRKAVPGV